ncbi:MAG: hypothetical protein FAF03_06735 [Epsilonproteobacteria bacterium]|nr:hypothetical protein [Campylobacterota bacterium]
MKLEIESVSNGYVITVPSGEYAESERKLVVEEKEDEFSDDTRNEFQAFVGLIDQLAEYFGVNNTKHNTVGYISGLCSEYDRYDIKEMMEKSLENPRNNTGD